MTRDSSVGKKLPQAVNTFNGTSNQFAVLSSSEDILEEGELHHLDGIVMETEVIVTTDQFGPSFSTPTWVGEYSPTPIGAISPPSYVGIAHKEPTDSSGSSNEDSIDQLSKKAGRKYKKEIREEEAERIKTQGIQSTIQMSYGRNKRIRPPKRVITPSNLGK